MHLLSLNPEFRRLATLRTLVIHLLDTCPFRDFEVLVSREPFLVLVDAMPLSENAVERPGHCHKEGISDHLAFSPRFLSIWAWVSSMVRSWSTYRSRISSANGAQLMVASLAGCEAAILDQDAAGRWLPRKLQDSEVWWDVDLRP